MEANREFPPRRRDAAVPRETVPRAADARRRHRLPVVWAGRASARSLLRSLPVASAAAARRSSRRSSGPFAPFTNRAQQELSRFVRPAARQKLVGRLLSLRDFRGGFALTDQDGATSLALAPVQSARCLEGGEKGVSFAHWRLRYANREGLARDHTGRRGRLHWA